MPRPDLFAASDVTTPPNPAAHAPDVRTLSLSQLHRLAGQGSRRAHAELERRMQASTTSTREARRSASPRHDSAPTPAKPPPPERTPAAQADPAALLDSWQLIERQHLERSRADGPPRLVGLVLIAWGVLLGLGGLALLARNGNAYYLLCGVAVAAVGALLMRVSRWAVPLHGVLIAVLLAWAWRAGGGLQVLLQAAPLWIPAAWIAVPAVREPLR